MPRNGSSVYSLPAGNPVIPGTIIATTWANTTLTDIATALTNSLSTDGSTAAVSLAGKTMSGGTFSGPTVTGILTASGGQIAFPAVQVPSANANTLDDYEEGTFSPSFSFTTPGNLNVIYAFRIGTYTKIGNSVACNIYLNTTTFSHTTAAGTATITGLPFASTESFGGPVMLQSLVGGAAVSVGALCTSGTTTLDLNGINTTTGTFSLIVPGNMPSGTQKIFAMSFNYKAS